jgi:hypothetical protein
MIGRGPGVAADGGEVAAVVKAPAEVPIWRALRLAVSAYESLTLRVVPAPTPEGIVKLKALLAKSTAPTVLERATNPPLKLPLPVMEMGPKPVSAEETPAPALRLKSSRLKEEPVKLVTETLKTAKPYGSPGEVESPLRAPAARLGAELDAGSKVEQVEFPPMHAALAGAACTRTIDVAAPAISNPARQKFLFMGECSVESRGLRNSHK